MGLAADVYAELLSRYKHGHPLWKPSPETLGTSINLADFGGCPTSPFKHNMNAGGVPAGFVPMTFSRALRCTKEDVLDSGTLCSDGTESREVKAHIAA